MRRLILAGAALGFLAASPAFAAAATPQAQPMVVAAVNDPAPAHGGFLHQLFARRQAPQNENRYGDPFDASQRQAGQVILVPVGG